jgi:hypothetical protein
MSQQKGPRTDGDNETYDLRGNDSSVRQFGTAEGGGDVDVKIDGEEKAQKRQRLSNDEVGQKHGGSIDDFPQRVVKPACLSLHGNRDGIPEDVRGLHDRIQNIGQLTEHPTFPETVHELVLPFASRSLRTSEFFSEAQ